MLRGFILLDRSSRTVGALSGVGGGAAVGFRCAAEFFSPLLGGAGVLAGKDFFVVTTNQDTRFVKLYPEEQVAQIQGDHRFFQCARYVAMNDRHDLLPAQIADRGMVIVADIARVLADARVLVG